MRGNDLVKMWVLNLFAGFSYFLKLELANEVTHLILNIIGTISAALALFITIKNLKKKET